MYLPVLIVLFPLSNQRWCHCQFGGLSLKDGVSLLEMEESFEKCLVCTWLRSYLFEKHFKSLYELFQVIVVAHSCGLLTSSTKDSYVVYFCNVCAGSREASSESE